MRGTLHFVAAPDVRWMLSLLAPRVIATSARRMRQLGLDDGGVSRAREAFVRALQGGHRLTREEMRRVLEDAGVDTSGQRGYHLLWRCAVEGLICPGNRRGKQDTFVLLDEWVPSTRSLARDEALAELARRYFTAHGPATVRDFAWWSGLAAADARLALELAADHLARDDVDGVGYWSSLRAPAPRAAPTRARLLPAFDEYLVGYTDRGALLDPVRARQVNAGGGLLGPTVVLDTRIGGVWKRRLAGKAVAVEVRLFHAPGPGDGRALEAAAGEYAQFLGRPLDLSVAGP